MKWIKKTLFPIEVYTYNKGRLEKILVRKMNAENGKGGESSLWYKLKKLLISRLRTNRILIESDVEYIYRDVDPNIKDTNLNELLKESYCSQHHLPRKVIETKVFSKENNTAWLAVINLSKLNKLPSHQRYEIDYILPEPLLWLSILSLYPSKSALILIQNIGETVLMAVWGNKIKCIKRLPGTIESEYLSSLHLHLDIITSEHGIFESIYYTPSSFSENELFLHKIKTDKCYNIFDCFQENFGDEVEYSMDQVRVLLANIYFKNRREQNFVVFQNTHLLLKKLARFSATAITILCIGMIAYTLSNIGINIYNSYSANNVIESKQQKLISITKKLEEDQSKKALNNQKESIFLYEKDIMNISNLYKDIFLPLSKTNFSSLWINEIYIENNKIKIKGQSLSSKESISFYHYISKFDRFNNLSFYQNTSPILKSDKNRSRETVLDFSILSKNNEK